MEEQSYEPVVPVKVGNRRASARSGHGAHWRDGGNRWCEAAGEETSHVRFEIEAFCASVREVE